MNVLQHFRFNGAPLLITQLLVVIHAFACVPNWNSRVEDPRAGRLLLATKIA